MTTITNPLLRKYASYGSGVDWYDYFKEDESAPSTPMVRPELAVEESGTSTGISTDYYSKYGRYAPTASAGGGESGITTSGFGTIQQPSPTGRTTITQAIKPTGAVPTLAPTPAIPKIDESRIRKLSRKAAAPGIRSLTRETRRALLRHYENPNVAKMVARGALGGHGEALSKILSTAGREGRAEYQQEYQAKLMEWQAKRQDELVKFQAAWNDYLRGYGQKTTTQYTYGRTATGGAGSKPRTNEDYTPFAYKIRDYTPFAYQ